MPNTAALVVVAALKGPHVARHGAIARQTKKAALRVPPHAVVRTRGYGCDLRASSVIQSSTRGHGAGHDDEMLATGRGKARGVVSLTTSRHALARSIRVQLNVGPWRRMSPRETLRSIQALASKVAQKTAAVGFDFRTSGCYPAALSNQRSSKAAQANNHRFGVKIAIPSRIRTPCHAGPHFAWSTLDMAQLLRARCQTKKVLGRRCCEWCPTLQDFMTCIPDFRHH